MSDSTNNIVTVVAIIVAVAIAIPLVVGGIEVINNSQDIYNASVEYNNHVDTTKHPGQTAMAPAYTAVKEGYAQALLYFTLAVGVLLMGFFFPRLQNITFGGIGLTLRDIPVKMDNLARQVNALHAASTGEGGQHMETMVLKQTLPGLSNVKTAGWTKDAEAGHHKMHVAVSKSALDGYYEVKATVSSMDSRHFPLTGLVTFHLDKNFSNPDPMIAVLDGKAVLELDKVVGPFMLVAEAGGARMAIDLNAAFDSGRPH